MAGNDPTFEHRLHVLSTKHKAAARGRVREVTPDGLILARPRRRRPRFPFRGLSYVAGTALILKATLFVYLGESVYLSRVDTLRGGTPVERAGAVLMTPDPATRAIAEAWGPLLR